jgi:hypothetical protein
MNNWKQRKDDWQVAVARSLTLSAPEADQFLELDRAKRIALDCAREVLGITVTGGKLSRIIPHHSKEAKRLKARLTLLRVVRREIHARKELGGVWPSRAMRKAWDAGLYPQPADFAMLRGLWQERNQAWTTEWLRMLRRQSASATDEWHQLRKIELHAAAERARLNAITRFYSGRELQRLLHPRAPTQHSPALFTDTLDMVTVTGNSDALAVFKDGLDHDTVQA